MSDDTNSSNRSSLVPADDARIVLSTAPPGEAARLAHQLVEEELAVCVNLVPGLRSIYRWKGQIADDPETLLVMKASPSALEALAARLVELHPYEVPELLTLQPEAGLAPYLAWVSEQGTNR